MRKVLFLVLFLTCMLGIVSNIQATTINVPTDYTTIQAAINAATAGDVVMVAAGTYNEVVNVNKSIILRGAGMDNTTIVGPSNVSASMTLSANNITVEHLCVTRAGNNPTEWAGNINSSGISISNQRTGCIVQYCKVIGNRNGIYLNDTGNHILRNNLITNNRTGINIANRVYDLSIVDNDITNNWTLGIVIYYLNAGATASSNVVVHHNNISGNWYGQVECKTASAGNPTTSYDFTQNWLGSATPYAVTTLAGEPGYAGQIPVEFGGTATNPVTNNGKISGDLSGKISYLPYYREAAMTNLSAPVTNVTQSLYYTTIQAAVTAANPGDELHVANGTYTITSQLSIYESLSIIGESEAGVIINTTACPSYGFDLQANNITLRNFTIIPNTGTASNSYTLKFNPHSDGTPYSNAVLEHITINGGYKTPFDVNGYNNVTLSYLTATNTIRGNGISLSGCQNVTLSHITTSNNAWGGVAVYVSTWAHRGSSNINMDFGTCNIAEYLYVEDESGYYNTDINLSNWTYAVNNDYSIPNNYTAYSNHPLATAFSVAAALNLKFSNTKSFVFNPSLNAYAAPTISVQAAIDGTTSGHAVYLTEGIYTEQLLITTNNIAIHGVSRASTTIKSPATLALSFTTSAANKPVVFIEGVTAFTMTDVTVDGDYKGNANYRFLGVGFWNAGGTLENVDVLRVSDNPFSGAQHCVAVYAYNNTTGTTYHLNLSNMNILDFQKNATALNGDGDLIVDIDNVTVVGQGTTPVTAQNGIQIWGASGTVSNCNISNIAWSGGTNWTAAGMLIIGPGNVTASNMNIANCQVSVDWEDADGVIQNSHITNPVGDGMYFYSTDGTHNVLVDNVTLTGADVVGSWGISPLAYTNGTMNLTVSHCTVTHFNYGLYAYKDAELGSTLNTVAHYNKIYNNTIGFGTNAATTQDAAYNWWGDARGPQNPSNPFNAITTGNAVADNITFMPWYATTTTAPGREFAGLTRNVGRALIEVFTSDQLTTALANCASGDQIILGSNTFVGNFTIPTGITLQADTNTVPVIMGDNGIALTLTGDNIHISGITIQAVGTYPAVEISGNTSNGTTISGSSILAASGYALENATTSHTDIAIDNNWWGSSNPNWANLIGWTGNSATQQDPPATLLNTLPVALYVSAPSPLIKDGVTQTLAVKVMSVSEMRAFTIRVKVPKADFDTPTNFVLGGAFTGITQFYQLDISDASYYIYDVSGSIFGQTAGVSGNDVTLFTLDVTSSADVNNLDGSLITLPLENVTMRTVSNPPANIPCIATTPASIIIDSAEPTMDAIPQVSGTTIPISITNTLAHGYPSTDAVNLGLSFNDNYRLNNLLFKIQPTADAAPTAIADFTLTPIASAINSATWTNGAWAIPDAILNANVNDLPTGDYKIYFLSVDRAGNFTITNWDFSIDKSATEPAVWVSCLTTPNANNSIDLAWTNPVGASKIHIWALDYNDLTGADGYPEYNPSGFAVPAIPGTLNPYNSAVQNGWTRVANDLTGESYSYTPAGRGYYYFTIFVEDAMGNMSNAPAAPFYRESISYWPGDVTGLPNGIDPVVALNDVALLSAKWGLHSTDAGWDNTIDVGPTTDYARRSRPTPDNVINIEDLMIFAMNYNNTDYSYYNRNLELPQIAPIQILIRTHQTSEQVVADLVLTGNSGFVKGLNIPIRFGQGLRYTSYTNGDIWSENSLVLSDVDNSVVTISGSILGDGVIPSNGVIATLTFKVTGDDQELTLRHMLARSITNAEITIIDNPEDEPTDNEEPVVIPTKTYLGNNYPNPFNPVTTIGFGLKQAGSVRISIYNTRGQEVKTLVNTIMPAGIHSIVWNGKDNHNRNVASGMYYYKMQTSDYTKIKKAIVLK